MKKIYLNFFIFLSFFSMIFAQWQPDVRLTNDPANSWISDNHVWSVASNGNTVHVVWFDNRDGNWEIYYKRSPDGGLSWGTDLRLTNNSTDTRYPSLSVSGLNVLVVWGEGDPDKNLYCKRSTDDGLSWGANTPITSNLSAKYPSALLTGVNAHLVWDEYSDGNDEIYYKLSTNGGINWGQNIRLTNNSGDSWYPSISVTGLLVHVVWMDSRDGNWEIYYKRSPDGGLSWGQDIRLTNFTASSYHPSVAVSGSYVHVVWQDARDGNWEIYFKRSTDGGLNWGLDSRLTSNSALSEEPTITTSGSNLHIVWFDGRDGNNEIYNKLSTNSGLNWGTDTRLTNNSADSWYASISVSGTTVHVVWRENRDGNYEIYYKRNPTGNPVGLKNISSVIPEEFSLEQNYPNPFNPTTKIRFDVTVDSRLRGNDNVELKVYDLLGREVETLVNEQLKSGTYEVEFDGTNYPSGVYCYKIVAGSFSQTKKMVLIK